MAIMAPWPKTIVVCALTFFCVHCFDGIILNALIAIVVIFAVHFVIESQSGQLTDFNVLLSNENNGVCGRSKYAYTAVFLV